MWMEMCRYMLVRSMAMSMTTVRRRRISSSWVAMTVVVVCLAAVAAAQMKVAMATGAEELGDVGEYWQKRTQESRLRNRGGPLHDLVAAATRFHQGLLDHRNGRRYLLAVPGEDDSSSAAADAPSSSSSSSSSTGTTGGAAAGHNTLADHDIMG